MKKKYIVQVLNKQTNAIVKVIECGESARKAERVLSGVQINIGKEYWARMKQVKA